MWKLLFKINVRSGKHIICVFCMINPHMTVSASATWIFLSNIVFYFSTAGSLLAMHDETCLLEQNQYLTHLLCRDGMELIDCFSSFLLGQIKKNWQQSRFETNHFLNLALWEDIIVYILFIYRDSRQTGTLIVLICQHL